MISTHTSFTTEYGLNADAIARCICSDSFSPSVLNDLNGDEGVSAAAQTAAINYLCQGDCRAFLEFYAMGSVRCTTIGTT